MYAMDPTKGENVLLDPEAELRIISISGTVSA